LANVRLVNNKIIAKIIACKSRDIRLQVTGIAFNLVDKGIDNAALRERSGHILII